MIQLSPRQIHLDFHTSENIPDIGACFDAQDFARTAKEASVSSMTVFARCHHGWLYYDSKNFPELVHPNLQNKNLLVEQVRALHAQGVRAPVYITVQWDYHSATTRPEWLIRKQDGAHEGDSFTEPGFYQSLCVNTSYWGFLKAHTEEVCALLGNELDGIFFDIVGIRPCWCAACRKEMKANGIDASDDEAVRAFAKFVLDRFKSNMTEVVRAYNKDCTIFYNAGHVGPCSRESAESYTHFELESLPSGGWGYLHFPVTARYARKLGLDCMGMTGKFHTSWGDFHSLKNLAALEFEAFRMLSFGFACSIGDQLEPNGKLNPATYRLIGKVYSQIADREEWARPSVALTEVGVLTCEDPIYEHRMPDSILGAAQLLEELSVQFDILDQTMELDGYRLIIVPDDFKATKELQQKLDAYAQGGGHIIACCRGGLNADGQYPHCYQAQYLGDTEAYPDFLIADGTLAGGLEPENEYAIYMQGAKIVPTGAETILSARAPYFKRSGDKFCSHRYTPSAKGASYPAATRSGNTILFSHPLFSQYRDNAPLWVKQLIKNALDLLLPERLVRHDGPSTVSVQLLHQPEKNRVCAHILSYIPVRKSATVDIIEERTTVNNLTLHFALPCSYKKAKMVPENIELDVTDGSVTIPAVNGYAIVELS
jgi:hypothetical protein